MYPENFPFLVKNCFWGKVRSPSPLESDEVFLFFRDYSGGRNENNFEWKYFCEMIFSWARRDCFCFVLWNCRFPLSASFLFHFCFWELLEIRLENVLFHEWKKKKILKLWRWQCGSKLMWSHLKKLCSLDSLDTFEFDQLIQGRTES